MLTHEAVIDIVWDDQLQPMLLARFPKTTPDGLKQAHAYAYGGCVLQDIGYYPFGSHFLSDLMHYVRSGDFVSNLLRDATDVDEYAFALGVLAHYEGDEHGHPYINEATARENPKLAAKYGNSVVYDEDPTAHVRTEFGFDVMQVEKGRYQAENYRNFIGFKVATPLLERGFRDTYGFEVKQLMGHEEFAINTYRRSVSKTIPELTRVAWASFGKQIQQEQPSASRNEFLYHLSRADYEKDYGAEYTKPGFKDNLLAFFLHLLPKIGPLKKLDVKVPDSGSQTLYFKSVDETVNAYREALKQVAASGVTMQSLHFDEINLDTGKPTQQGAYPLADKTYSELLIRLTQPSSPPIPTDLRTDILAFYAPADAKDAVRSDPKQWSETQSSLELLRNAKPDMVKVSDQQTSQQTPAVPVDAADPVH